MVTGGMSYFKKPDKFRAYIVLFTIAVVVAFAAILLIPYFYDQINLSQFQHAYEKNQLLIAELPAELQFIFCADASSWRINCGRDCISWCFFGYFETNKTSSW